MSIHKVDSSVTKEQNNVSFEISQMQKSLPIYNYKHKINTLVANHDVSIITGETGCGKSTQLPQYLLSSEEVRLSILEGGEKAQLNIVVTQPRRVAATAMARRVSYEMESDLGDKVGYAIRFENKTSNNTQIRFVTDGVLVRECLMDRMLQQYDVVMLDEAHERSLATDILFALLKQALYMRNDACQGDKASVRRNRLKLIVSSATMECRSLSQYFNGAPVLNMEGRCFAVEVKYGECNITRRVEESVTSVIRLHLHESAGDILVFLPGSEDCELAAHKCLLELEKLVAQGRAVPPLMILPLYGAQPSEEQNKVFAETPENGRKVVFATNVAETALTISNIGFVIDCGYVKQKQYNAKTGMDSLLLTPISRSQATQRTGRAGRTQPGKCFRMYSQEFHDTKMAEHAVPEIARVALCEVILELKAMGINDIARFDFLEPPDSQQLQAGMKQLHLLNALDADGGITVLGRQMTHFPLNPCFSKALISSLLTESELENYAFDINMNNTTNACDCSISESMLSLISMLSSEQIWARVPPTSKNHKEFIQKQKQHSDSSGDHFTMLGIYANWVQQKCSEFWCRQNYVNFRALNQAQNIKVQLRLLVEELKAKWKETGEYKSLKQFYYSSGESVLEQGIQLVKSEGQNKQSKKHRKRSEQNGQSLQHVRQHLLRLNLLSGFFFNSAKRMLGMDNKYLLIMEGNIITIDSLSVYSFEELYPSFVLFTELSGTTLNHGIMRTVSGIDEVDIQPYFKRMKQVDIKRIMNCGLITPSGNNQLLTTTTNQSLDNEKVQCLIQDKNQKAIQEGKIALEIQQDKVNKAKDRYFKRKKIKMQ